MSNTDAPRGFIAARSDHGGPPSIGQYVGSTTVCYPGDALQWSSGKVIPLVDAQVDVMGVCAEYHDGTDGDPVLVYDDLKNTTFEVQTDDASFTSGVTQAHIGTEVDVKVTTGDTVRLTSKHEIMSSTDDAQFQIEKIVDRPDNDSSAVNCKVRGRFVKVTNAAAHTAIA